MIRLLAAPGRGVMKIVGAGLTLFTRAVQAVIGGQMLADAAQFVQLFEGMFGGFRARAQATYELLRQPGTAFVVVATCEADALREASYFADRLRRGTDAAGRAGAQPHASAAGRPAGGGDDGRPGRDRNRPTR